MARSSNVLDTAVFTNLLEGRFTFTFQIIQVKGKKERQRERERGGERMTKEEFHLCISRTNSQRKLAPIPFL